MPHPFGELLTVYRTRKRGLSQARLAQAVGYDPAVLARMCNGKKDLTGPSGREKVLRIVNTLHRQGLLHSTDEANALLAAGNMPPLYEGIPMEAALLNLLRGSSGDALAGTRIHRLAERIHHNLPAPITTFIGRKAEVMRILEHLARTRLLTLTGAGGVGKTRLALKVATELANTESATLDDGPLTTPMVRDGIWWVEFAAVHDRSSMLQALARVLNVNDGADQTLDHALVHRLKDKHALLVLDNCEHVLESCAVFVIAALQACAHLRILATSREDLNVMGETVWPVAGLQMSLSLGPSGTHAKLQEPTDSEQLFYERALAVNPHLVLSPPLAATIAQICQRLDGMPLAIELAAVQTSMLSVDDIAARLDDQFELLATHRRMVLPRHQTLRATLDWSDSLLTDEERLFFHRLSKFVGGWTAEAAQHVAGAGLSQHTLLTHLVDKSLVLVESRDGRVRYRMLEPVRQYALAKLRERGEEAQTQLRHLHYFALFANDMDVQMTEMGLVEWMARFGAEHHNLLAAMAWANARVQQTDLIDVALQLATSATYGWDIFGYYAEGLSCLTEAFARSDALDSPASAFLRIKALHNVVKLLISLGHWQRLSQWSEPCERVLMQCRHQQDRVGEAYALHVQGTIAWAQGDLSRAQKLNEDSLQLFSAMDHARGIWMVALLHFDILRSRNLHHERVTHLEWCLDQLKRLHDKWYFLDPLRVLAITIIERGHLARAARLLEDNLIAAEQIDDPYATLWAYELLELADYPRALALAERYLERQQHTHDQRRIAAALHQLGRILLDGHQSQYPRAKMLLDESVGLWQTLGILWTRTDGLTHTLITQGHLARCSREHAYADVCYAAALKFARDANDRGLTALALLWHSHTQCFLGKSADAIHGIKHSLVELHAMRWTTASVLALGLLSGALCAAQQLVLACRFAGVCAAHDHELALLSPNARHEWNRTISSINGLLANPHCAAAWDEGQHTTLVQAVALACDALNSLEVSI